MRERERERDPRNGREGGESGNGYSVKRSFAKFIFPVKALPRSFFEKEIAP